MSKKCERCGKQITCEEYYSEHGLCERCLLDVTSNDESRVWKNGKQYAEPATEKEWRYYCESWAMEEQEELDCNFDDSQFICPKCGNHEMARIGSHFEGDTATFEELECPECGLLISKKRYEKTFERCQK